MKRHSSCCPSDIEQVNRTVLTLVLLLAALPLSVAALPTTVCQAKDQSDQDKRPNVLFIISDDLSAEALSCYGNEQCQTPNLDRLATRAKKFTNAYCQYPVCGPSRAALMSGMYPRSIGVMGNGQSGQLTKNLGDRPSMAQRFKENGYYSARVSKIYHMRIPGDITKGVSGPDHAASWDLAINFHCPEWMSQGEHEHLSNERLRFDKDVHYNLGFGTAFYVVEGSTDGSEQPDYQAADKAIEIMKSQKDEPFILAVGMVRPHVPLVAPAEFYEDYSADSMTLPEKVAGDWEDIPKLGITKSSRSTGIKDDLDKQRRILRAYYASVTFMDAQAGKILDALKSLGLEENTIVVFTSDHGYHLGEHDFWQKMSLHDESVRIPLLIAGPGIEPGEIEGLAQQIDLYPTLVEQAGLTIPDHCQGKSLLPLLESRSEQVHEAVFSTKRTGDLIRTANLAMIRHRDGTHELYDMVKDPKQFTNLAEEEAWQSTIEKLDQQLDLHIQATTPKAE